MHAACTLLSHHRLDLPQYFFANANRSRISAGVGTGFSLSLRPCSACAEHARCVLALDFVAFFQVSTVMVVVPSTFAISSPDCRSSKSPCAVVKAFGRPCFFGCFCIHRTLVMVEVSLPNSSAISEDFVPRLFLSLASSRCSSDILVQPASGMAHYWLLWEYCTSSTLPA